MSNRNVRVFAVCNAYDIINSLETVTIIPSLKYIRAQYMEPHEFIYPLHYINFAVNHDDGLVQDCCILSAKALEIVQS